MSQRVACGQCGSKRWRPANVGVAARQMTPRSSVAPRPIPPHVQPDVAPHFDVTGCGCPACESRTRSASYQDWEAAGRPLPGENEGILARTEDVPASWRCTRCKTLWAYTPLGDLAQLVKAAEGATIDEIDRVKHGPTVEEPAP